MRPISREYTQGSFVSVAQKQKGDRRAFINSVGEGAIWVADINGPLEWGLHHHLKHCRVRAKAGRCGSHELHGCQNHHEFDFEPETPRTHPAHQAIERRRDPLHGFGSGRKSDTSS